MSEDLESGNGQPALPGTTADLLQRSNDAWAELSRLLDSLDAEQMTSTDAQGWTVKDHMAHITTWEKSLLAFLGGQDPLAAMGLDPEQLASREVDRLNEGIYQANRSRPLAEVRSDFRATHDEIMAVLARLDNADLHRPHAYFQPDDPRNRQDPAIDWIAADTYEHYEEHIPWINAILDKGS